MMHACTLSVSAPVRPLQGHLVLPGHNYAAAAHSTISNERELNGMMVSALARARKLQQQQQHHHRHHHQQQQQQQEQPRRQPSLHRASQSTEGDDDYDSGSDDGTEAGNEIEGVEEHVDEEEPEEEADEPEEKGRLDDEHFDNDGNDDSSRHHRRQQQQRQQRHANTTTAAVAAAAATATSDAAAARIRPRNVGGGCRDVSSSYLPLPEYLSVARRMLELHCRRYSHTPGSGADDSDGAYVAGGRGGGGGGGAAGGTPEGAAKICECLHEGTAGVTLQVFREHVQAAVDVDLAKL